MKENDRVNLWSSPSVIAPNNSVYKSLSNWALNIDMWCSYACRIYYVPSAATSKQGPQLARVQRPAEPSPCGAGGDLESEPADYPQRAYKSRNLRTFDLTKTDT